MYRLTASYAHGADDAADQAIVAHYRDVHAGLAGALPDLRAFTWGVSETPDGSRPAHVIVAVLDWDSRDQALAALDSPAGKAAVGDLDNFAQAGVDLEFQEVVRTV